MKIYMIEKTPYVSLREMCKYIGINTGMYNYYSEKDPVLRTLVIENYRPREGGHKFHVISRDGAYRFVGHIIAGARNKNTDKHYKALDILEDRINFFNEHGEDEGLAPSPMSKDIQPETGGLVAQPIVTGYMPPTVDQGIEITNAIFDGHTVRCLTDDNGMQWVLGQDIRNAIEVDKNVFNKVVTRIRQKDPLTVKDSPAASWSLRGGRPRISLNKYGIAHFFMELDTERLKDPNTREKCNRFRVWVARLVGDVMTGDIEINQKGTQPTISPNYGMLRIPPADVYGIVTNVHAELAVGLQMGMVFDKIPAREIFNIVCDRITEKTHFDMKPYVDALHRHYNEHEPLVAGQDKMRIIQRELNSLTEETLTRVKEFDNSLKAIPLIENRMKKIEVGFRNVTTPKHMIASMENNGLTKREINKIIADADNCAANDFS
jgi:hypothetical protein